MSTSARSARSMVRIAVGVDGYPEGRDAVVLAETIAGAIGAEVMLVAVHTDPLVVLPSEMNWNALEHEAELAVREARDALAPDARVCVETDLSIVRGLERVVKREHRDLLVVGSSRSAADGRVRIDNGTRQLFDHGFCAVAVAPRGIHREPGRLAHIGVGYDGSPESRAALRLAASIALAAGLTLRVRGVVDDRIRSIGWSRMGPGAVLGAAIGGQPTGSAGAIPEWDQTVAAAATALRLELGDAVRAVGMAGVTDVRLGRPASALLELSEQVDLLVIGSRRWAAVARLILGSTGEALLHDASCGMLVVPRPRK